MLSLRLELRSRYSPGVVVLLGLAAAACSTLIVAYATQSGLGLFGDSVDYVAAARQLAAGNGVMTLDGAGGFVPLTQFPPGYSFLLAAAAKGSGAEVIEAARIVHLLLHALILIVTFEVARRTSGHALVGLAVGAMVAFTPSLLAASSRLLSETTFIALELLVILLLLQAMQSKRRLALLVVAGVAAGVAILTRYAGTAVAAAGVFWLVSRTAASLRERVRDAALFASPAAVLPGAWSLHNMLISGQPTSRTLGFHPPGGAWFAQGADALANWLLPDFGRWSIWVATLVVLPVIVLAVILLWREMTGGTTISLLTANAAAYLIVMGVSITFFDANIPLNARLLSPVFPTLTIILGAAGGRLVASNSRNAGVALLLLGTGLLVFNTQRCLRWSQKTGREGQGYASMSWRRSPTLAAIANTPVDHLIYTNAYDAIYLRTGRLARTLPKTRIRSANAADPAFPRNVDDMLQALRASGGWIIYFSSIDRTDFQIDEASLRQRSSLLGLLNSQPADGRIYTIAPDSSGPPTR